MTPRILLVATATRWLGTARMPRVLARAGFDVVLLTPSGSLAEKSRYVSRIGFLSPTANRMEWLLSLIAIVEAAPPTLIVPCDEMAVRLLCELILDPPPGFSSALRERLLPLVAASLGEPSFYEASIDKTMLPGAAEKLEVRVPRYAIVTNEAEARAHADALGYPVVLKRRYGFAGQGVEIVSGRTEVEAAARKLLKPDQLDLGQFGDAKLLVQAFVSGAYHSQALVALRGEPLMGFAWERHEATTDVKGQTTVLRFVRSPETRAFAEALCRGFGMSGFFNVQFALERGTGDAYLLEINRRIVTHTHLGERVGRDLGRALFDALAGNRVAEAGDAASGERVVIFPREWLRDPRSRNLTELPVDVPWDDPELLRAMLAMRDED